MASKQIPSAEKIKQMNRSDSVAVINLSDTPYDNTKNIKSSEESNDSSDTPSIENVAYTQNSPTSEVIRLGIFQRKDENLYVIVTFPTVTTIISMTPESSDKSLSLIQQTASIYGSTNGFVFNNQTQFPPGDYCLAFTFSNKNEVRAISGIYLTIKYEFVTNFMLSQMMFGMYRSLGFDPSHVMKYPSKTAEAPIPFYRKTRSEIEKLGETLSNKTIEIPNIDQLIQTQTKSILSELKKYDQLINLSSHISQISTMMGELSTYIREIGKNNTLFLEQINTIKEIGNNNTLFIDQVNTIQEISKNNESLQEQTKSMQDKLSLLGEKIENIQVGISKYETPNEIKIQDLIDRMSKIQESLDQVKNQEKGSDIQTVSIADIDKLMKEKDHLYKQLVKAEDYIEELCR